MFIKNFTISKSSGVRHCAALTRDVWDDLQVFKNLIIFSHGAGNDRFYPQKSLFKKILEESDSVIVTYDLDGHGKDSSVIFKSEIFLSTLPTFLADIPFNLVGRCEKTILIGHSSGGFLSLYAALEIPEKLDQVIVISPPWRLREKSNRYFLEFLGFFKWHVLKQIFNYGIYGSLPAFGRFKRSEFPIRLEGGSAEPYNYVTQVSAVVAMARTAFLVQTSVVKTTIIAGEKDYIVPYLDMLNFKKCFKNLELVFLPCENHLSTFFSRRCEQKILDAICYREVNSR